MLKPSVQIHNVDGLLVAEFWDCLRLDPAPVQELRNRYEEHVKAGGRPEIVIDLEGIGFAGSAALGNFVALHRSARQNGGRLVFCQVDPTVAEVFRASQLERLFEFVADRDAGIAAANRPPADPAADGITQEIIADRPRPASPVQGGLSRLRRKKPASDPE
jgi:anti-anti-sigma factor